MHNDKCFIAKCNRQGSLKHISQNDVQAFSSLKVNDNLVEYIIDMGGENIEDHLKDIYEMGSSIAKPIKLSEDEDKKMFLSGSKIYYDLTICICDSPNAGENNIYDELLRVNNELTNSIRKLTKSKTTGNLKSRESIFYEDLTKLNNELISAQRDLYKEIANREKAEEKLRMSERRYRLLADNSTDIIILHDVDGNIKYVSPSVENILKFRPDEFQDNNLFDFIDQKESDQLYSSFDRISNISGYTRIEHTINPNEGKEIWVETISKKIDSKSGDENLIISVMRDITNRKEIEEEVFNQHIELEMQNEELKKTQKELEHSYNKYYQLFDSAPVGYFNLNDDFTIINANRTVVSLLNQQLKEIIGKDFRDFVHADSYVQFRELLNRATDSEFMVRDEIKLIKQNTTDMNFHAIIEIISINKPDRDEKHYQMAIMDITDRIIAENQLKDSEKKLQEANSAKDKFFSIIAHDLKSPFFGVLGLSEHIKENGRSMEKLEIIDISNHIYNSLKQQYELLEGLLLWARSNTGRLKLENTIVSPNMVVEKTLNVLKHSVEEKNLIFVNNVDEDLTVLTDVNLMLTVIRNLISNAIKFTPSGGRIMVNTETKDDHTDIIISDTGIGINKEDMDKLFKIEEAFSTPGTNDEKGTGLGLIVCHEFAEKQGGELLVESNPGEGTTFIYRLPANK